jgi:hypothetical protein
MTIIIKSVGASGSSVAANAPPVSAADAAAAKAWLQQLVALSNGVSPSILTWGNNIDQWNQDGDNLLAFAQSQSGSVAQEIQAGAADLAAALSAGNVMQKNLQDVANLGAMGEVATIDKLLDAASTPQATASMNLAITPHPGLLAPGTNLAADASANLAALVAAIDAGDVAGAQTALNKIASDIQAIAAQGTTNAAATVQVGGVSTGKAVAVGVGGVLAGGIAGAIGHMMMTGASFAGESVARESKKKKKKRSW